MLKVGPTFETEGDDWDHEGKSEIAQILISYSANYIKYIHFLYVDNNSNLVLSDAIGGKCGAYFDTITLDYPSEFITSLSGQYTEIYTRTYLSSITFGTNKATYGPFSSHDPRLSDATEFNYQMGSKVCGFCGFFGTSLVDRVESIGFYMKPLEKLSDIVQKKDESEMQKSQIS